MASRFMTAEQTLATALKHILGPKLPGVNGYGARWDRNLNAMSLGVYVDDSIGAAPVAKALPDNIEGLPVVVTTRGPASGG